jgi:hypothetical protein
MLNAISQFCYDYYDQIPAHSLRAIGLSAVTTFTATVILLAASKGSNKAVDVSRPVLGAGIALMAATIHALTIPIFNYLFDNNGIYNPYQEAVHVVFSMTLTQLLINRVTSLNINLLTSNLWDPHKDSFVIWTSSYIRIIGDIMLRALAYSCPAPIISSWRSDMQDWGINFNQTTPIYLPVFNPSI